MQEIEKLRSEIDQIHKEMVDLFRKRLDLTLKIGEIKKMSRLPLLDQKREDVIIHQFDDLIDNHDERTVVQSFLKSLLSESKKFLEAKI